MDTVKLSARNGDAVHQIIELGERVPLDTASAELMEALSCLPLQVAFESDPSFPLADTAQDVEQC